jgi:hypothetical protein
MSAMPEESSDRIQLLQGTLDMLILRTLLVFTRLRKKTRMAARDAVIKWSTNQPL